MIEDYYNILQILKQNKDLKDINNLTDIIIEGFKYEVITKSEELLLNLIFSNKTSQKDLDDFLEKWDIEAVGGHKALLLSYFMKMHPELKFSAYVTTRLKGLLQFYRFQNMKLISHYTKICNMLQKQGTEFLIFKGGCIKHLRPEFPRIMGDIDILVHENDYQKSGKMIEQMGYDTVWDIHSVDIHLKGSKDV